MNYRCSSNCDKYNTNNPLKRYCINRFLESIAELSSLSGGESICDIGCGEGFVLKFLTDKYPGLDVEGYDLDPAALEYAKKTIPGCKFDVLRIEQCASLSHIKYDLVLVLEVLEHVHDYNRALESLDMLDFKRMIISVPDEPWFSLSNFMAGKNIRNLGKDPEHVNFWGKKTFLELLSGVFEIKKIRTPFPWIVVDCEKR